jgi:hypothetical protein
MRNNFDTVLPKSERASFFSPPVTKPKPKTKPPVWGYLSYLIIGSIAGAALAFAINREPRPRALDPRVEEIFPTPTPAPPLPEVRRAAPMPVLSTPVTPRAQLVHIRQINTWENDRLPDGRILATLYKGELPSAASLPRTGNWPGDMWYTRNDGHSWVLAPVAAGSQTTGWVDP